MKILLLSDINSEHTIKWTNLLVDNSIDVAVFSLTIPNKNVLSEIKIQKIYVPSYLKEKSTKQSLLSKIYYLKGLPDLLYAIDEFKPDIVHAHYASSYGLLGRKSKFKPYIISAWGSDILIFPNKSFIHKNILKKNLLSANIVTATSHLMVNLIKTISSIKAEHIPFGIDLNQFFPKKVNRPFNTNDIVFGSIKSFEHIYGHQYLIKAFAKLAIEFPERNIKLFLVGDGSLMNDLKHLVFDLGINDKVVFSGKIAYSEICDYHNMIDIFVNPSINESFGVSVLEASACEKPVIASNVGGLPEVVDNGKTGILVTPMNIEYLYQSMKNLLLNKTVAINMGKCGRQWVEQHYNFKINGQLMINLYRGLL